MNAFIVCINKEEKSELFTTFEEARDYATREVYTGDDCWIYEVAHAWNVYIPEPSPIITQEF